MRYEKVKALAAVMSVASVLVTLASVLLVDGTLTGSLDRFTIVVTIGAIVAGAAAFVALETKRRLARERRVGRVFVIYAREDLEAARQLVRKLKERGFNPWLDVDDIVPGDIWTKAVLGALEKSAVAIVLVSEHLLNKHGFVQEELKLAFHVLQQQQQDRGSIIPVRLSDVPVPEPLSRINWVDLFEPNGLERLERGLTALIT